MRKDHRTVLCVVSLIAGLLECRENGPEDLSARWWHCFTQQELLADVDADKRSRLIAAVDFAVGECRGGPADLLLQNLCF